MPDIYRQCRPQRTRPYEEKHGITNLASSYIRGMPSVPYGMEQIPSDLISARESERWMQSKLYRFSPRAGEEGALIERDVHMGHNGPS